MYIPGKTLANTTYFHGIFGGSQIVNQQEGGEVIADLWLNDAAFTTAALLYTYLTAQKSTVTSNGTLIFTKSASDYGAYTRTFLYATLMSVEEITVGSQEKPGPLMLEDNTTPFLAVRYKWSLLEQQ
jgi:hypothetical protein